MTTTANQSEVIAELQRQRDDLLAALEFYANPKSYVAMPDGSKCLALTDRGQHAAEAVRKARGE